jgi:hypothetical protein
MAIAKMAVVVLLAKVLAGVIVEYRWYLPPNF